MSRIGKGTKRKANAVEAKYRDDNDTRPCVEKCNIITSPQKKRISNFLRKKGILQTLTKNRANAMEGTELILQDNLVDEDDGNINDASVAIHSSPVHAMKLARTHGSND